MAGYQQVIIVGNIGSIEDLKYLSSGRAVVNFSVAVNKSWTDKTTNEKRESVTWFRVAVFGAQAEVSSKYLSKGQQVTVVGEIGAQAYIDKAGEARASLDVTARDVVFGARGDGVSQDRGQSGGESSDLPF